MEDNIRIYRLPKDRGMDQWILPQPEVRKISVSQSVPEPKGSMSILILPSISVTIMFIALKTELDTHSHFSRNQETYKLSITSVTMCLLH